MVLILFFEDAMRVTYESGLVTGLSLRFGILPVALFAPLTPPKLRLLSFPSIILPCCTLDGCLFGGGLPRLCEVAILQVLFKFGNIGAEAIIGHSKGLWSHTFCVIDLVSVSVKIRPICGTGWKHGH